MTTTKELCSLCTEETGRAGRHEDSIYICPGLPCEVGPLCETCYNSFAAFFATEERELLTIAYMSGQSDASTKLKADKKELISALGALVVKYKTMTPYKHLELDVAESVLEKHMTVTEKVDS